MEQPINEKTKFELSDTEGLNYLRWSMFDSPDKSGSGKMFMDRPTVLILDEIVKKTRMILDIQLGYVSKAYADRKNMSKMDSHRVGKAVRLKCISPKKRIKIIYWLMIYGVKRVAVGKDYIYFDTDDLKEDSFYIW